MKKLSNEVKIGLTAIAAGILLFVGINFLKGINIFEATNSYYVKFKDAKGLAVSNAVYANGYPVGIVREINYNYDGNEGVVVRIELDEQMRVPRHTTAELESALMGGVTMHLILGRNPMDNLAPHDTISGHLYQGTMDKAAAMLPDVQRMLPKLDSILTGLNNVIGDPALLQTLQNAAVISENMKTSSAHLNELMNREVPHMLSQLSQASSNANQITAELADAKVGKTIETVNDALHDVQKMSGQLNTMITDVQQKMNSSNNNLGAFLQDRKLYDRLNSIATNTDSLIIDFKARPKRYVHFSIFGKKAQ